MEASHDTRTHSRGPSDGSGRSYVGHDPRHLGRRIIPEQNVMKQRDFNTDMEGVDHGFWNFHREQPAVWGIHLFHRDTPLERLVGLA